MDHTINPADHTAVVPVKLFDTEIEVKKYACSLNKGPADRIDPYVNLYININDVCQANCSFCEYHKETKRKFDLDKLKYTIKELNSRGIAVNKVNFSGGEPMINPDLIEEIIPLLPEVYVTINTNGFNFNKTDKIASKVDCISLSRHHYDDDVNDEIFKCNTPSLERVASFSDKVKLHLRCNMMKEYIDSQDEAMTYIDVTSMAGIMDYGFVSLMKINPFCEENFIDHNILDWSSHERAHTCYSQERSGVCSCNNYLYYTKEGNLVKLYSRASEDFKFEASNLVFDIDVVKKGFNGKIIF